MKRKGVFLISLIALICVGVFNYLVFKYKVLGVKNIDFYVLITTLLLCVVMLIFNLRKLRKSVAVVIAILLIISTSFGTYWVIKIKNTFNELNTVKIVEKIKVVVLKDSSIQKIEDLDDALDYSKEDDKAMVDVIFNQIKEKKQYMVLIAHENYSDLYSKLQSKSVDAIIVNEKFVPYLEEIAPGFNEKTRVIHEYVKETTEVIEEVKPSQEMVKKMNIYVSGIDSYGNIGTVSRSDVNIVMSANLEKGKVLLTSTPRDAYVKMPINGVLRSDKLTHAGLYGVNASMQALEGVYDIKIPYYIRLNFTAFMNIIDLLGGIEIENDQSFTSYHIHHFYKKGTLKLNSRLALEFVRERYNLKNGDIDRAKNQSKIIEAILKKMTSPESVVKVGSILKQITNSIQTNIPFTTLMEWINYHVNSGNKLSVESVAVSAHGTMNLKSYLMPSAKLYMSIIDKKSLEEIKLKMTKVFE